MLILSDDHEIFRGYTTLIELYNELKFITMLFFIQKILTFNLGVAFLKSVSIRYLRCACAHIFQKSTWCALIGACALNRANMVICVKNKFVD